MGLRQEDFDALEESGARPEVPVPGDVLVPFADLRALGIPFTREHAMVLVKRGQFPRPVRLSPNRVAWRKSDLERWIGSRPLSG